MTILTISSEDEMRALAARLATSAKAKDVFLLQGPLGAGKSAFARGFIQSLCGEDTEVPSPTFTLVQTYDAQKALLWHFDLYRIEDPDDVYETGFEEALADGITLIEWPEKLGPHIPKHARWIKIAVTGPQSREVTLNE